MSYIAGGKAEKSSLSKIVDRSDILYTMYDSLQKTENELFYTFRNDEGTLGIIRQDGRVLLDNIVTHYRLTTLKHMNIFILSSEDFNKIAVYSKSGNEILKTNYDMYINYKERLNLVCMYSPIREEFIIISSDGRKVSGKYLYVVYIELIDKLVGVRSDSIYVNSEPKIDIISTRCELQRLNVDWDNEYREKTGISKFNLTNTIYSEHQSMAGLYCIDK